MGRFKDFFFKHLGKSQDAKALYSYLQDNDYNKFDNIRLCDNFDGAEETHPQIATSLLRKKLHILKEFVALGGDYRRDELSFGEIHQQVRRANLQSRLISDPEPTSRPTSDEGLQQLLRRFLIAHSDPYAIISQAHLSKDDSESVRNDSITYYGLASAKFCQVLGQVDPNRVSVVNAHIWPRHAVNDLVLFDLDPSDIHHARNVLRLQKDIERAFDCQELTFIDSGTSPSAMVVKLLSSSASSSKITGTNLSLGDIDGRPLILPDGQQPFRRLIAHHCVVAYRRARAKGWVQEEDLSRAEIQASELMSHSLDEEGQTRLKLLWKTQ
mmetsp:Transcript_17151/g.24788  ORF Transcript_17151/g.24788 Transcript_17151/m.24788 type:complete len:326 (+) Transcript_17151:137-1114(+)